MNIPCYSADSKPQFFYGRQGRLDSDWYEKNKGGQSEQEESSVLVDNPKLNIKFSDFVPSNDTIYRRELTVDWDTLRENLTLAREYLAFH